MPLNNSSTIEEEVETEDTPPALPIGKIYIRCGFDLQGERMYPFGRMTIANSGAYEVDVFDEEEGVWETRIYPSEIVRKVRFPRSEEYDEHVKASDASGMSYWRASNSELL